jgi:hypothetical protein
MTKDRIDKLIAQKKEANDEDTLEFLESLRAGLDKWGELTAKQVAAFERIEYLSSAAGKDYVAAWQKEYSKNLKETAKICARYYLANPPYFNDIATKIVSNPEFIPTENQFRAMCENKYTVKVVKEYHRNPEYGNGDIVQVRDSRTMPYHLYNLRGKPCVVINNNSGLITTHAKGAKIYKILPFGQSKLFECQERHLKSLKPQKSA